MQRCSCCRRGARDDAWQRGINGIIITPLGELRQKYAEYSALVGQLCLFQIERRSHRGSLMPAMKQTRGARGGGGSLPAALIMPTKVFERLFLFVCLQRGEGRET
jgi:hypothetical protein